MENNIESTKIHIIPLKEKSTKIIIDTASDGSLINKAYYTEIGIFNLCQDVLYVLVRLGKEEMKPIGYLNIKYQECNI